MNIRAWFQKAVAIFAALEYFVFELFGWLAIVNPLYLPALMIAWDPWISLAAIIAISVFFKLIAKIAAHRTWILGIVALFIIGWLKYASEVESVDEAIHETLNYLKIVGIVVFIGALIYQINKTFGHAKPVTGVREAISRFLKKQIVSLYEHVVPDYQEQPETLFWGLLVYHIQYYICDVIIYGLVIWYFSESFGMYLGTMIGCLVMIPFTLLANVLWIWFYDKQKKDYIGIEAIKKDKFQTYSGEAAAGKFYRWMYKTRLRAFLWLTFRSDPTIATVFLRGNSYEFNGLGGKGLALLTVSTILANVVWAIRWGIVIWGGRLVVYTWQNPGIVISALEKLNLFFFAN